MASDNEVLHMELCWNDFFNLGCNTCEMWLNSGCVNLISIKYTEILINNNLLDYHCQTKVPNVFRWHSNYTSLVPKAREHRRYYFPNENELHIVNKQFYELMACISDCRFNIESIAKMGFYLGFIAYMIGNCEFVDPHIKRFYYGHIIHSFVRFIYKVPETAV
jgi:hypothetical protein